MFTPRDRTLVLEAVHARRPNVFTQWGLLGITYSVDEDGDEYAVVGLNSSPEMFAEIEDGTYGVLQGVRVYMDTTA